MTKEDALEVAKLAKSIGSHLGTIDSYMVEPNRRTSNQIDMNRFIAQVVNPNSPPTFNSQGYVPENLVQQIVPEPKYAITPEPAIENTQQNSTSRQSSKQKKQQIVETSPNLQVEDKTFKKIATSLERIAKSFEKYVDFHTQASIVKQNNILNG